MVAVFNNKGSVMKLYHDTDIAIEPIDDRSSLAKATQVNDEFYIPSSAKGKIKLLYDTTPDEHLQFIYDRMVNVYKENPNLDYMQKFKAAIKMKTNLGLEKDNEVYFDPRMMIEIKELNLVVIDQKSALIGV